jgi:ornithine--oxo-acid transaminase
VAAALGLEALKLLIEERLSERAAELGDYFLNKLCTLGSPLIREVQGKGLLLGVEIDPHQCSARHLCQWITLRFRPTLAHRTAWARV